MSSSGRSSGGGGAIGSTTFVRPSGDATGATDTTAINAALVTGSVTLNGDYTTNAEIVIPSNRTLILADAKVRLANGSNSNVIRNANQNATGDTDIHVRGIGRAIFDGNAVNQARNATPNFYKNIGALWVNVTRLTVDGVTLGPMNAYACCMQVCTDVRLSRINLAQDVSTANQDGFDIFGGSNITIDGVRGKTGDDLFGVFAFNTTGVGVIHPYTATLTAAQRSVDGVYVRDADVDIGDTPVRLIAGDASTIKRVFASDITNRHTSIVVAAFQAGPTSYVGTAPVAGDIDTVEFTKYRGMGDTVVALDSPINNLRVDGLDLTKWNKLIGSMQVVAGLNPEIHNVSVTNVHSGSLSPGPGTIVGFPTGYYVEGLSIRDVSLAQADSILNNVGSVAGLDLDNLRIGRLTGTAFRSATETGRADNISWASFAASPPMSFSAASQLRLGRNMPVLTSADTTPVARRGSVITADKSKDPTGGAGTTGGEYAGNGSVWTKVIDLGTLTVPPQVVPSSLAGTRIFHFDPAVLGLTDGAPVFTVPDLSSNRFDLAQATVAKRPTLAAAVGAQNRPGLRFTTASATNMSITGTLSQAAPLVLAAAFVLRTAPTADVTFVDGASPGAPNGFNAQFGHQQSSGKLFLYDGTANVLGPVDAAGTTYIMVAIVNGASSTVRINGTDYTGNPGPYGLQGLTVGSFHTGVNYGSFDLLELVAVTGSATADRDYLSTYLTAKHT